MFSGCDIFVSGFARKSAMDKFGWIGYCSTNFSCGLLNALEFVDSKRAVCASTELCLLINYVATYRSVKYDLSQKYDYEQLRYTLIADYYSQEWGPK
jgi:hypothetical protein